MGAAGGRGMTMPSGVRVPAGCLNSLVNHFLHTDLRFVSASYST